jgi:hypothetical protein
MQDTCNCICHEIDEFELTVASVLEWHGLGQDLIQSVLSHVCLLDRFLDRSAILKSISCKFSHETSALLKKFNMGGNAHEMLQLFAHCLQDRNDKTAARLLPFLVNLHHPSILLHEACKFGRSSIVEQLVCDFGPLTCIRQLGQFAYGCDCFQSALLSKADESEIAKIVELLCVNCKDVDFQIMRSAFNTAMRLRLRLVCDALLLRDSKCVCPLSAADAMVLCSERPLAILIANINTLALSPPELHDLACTAAAACRSSSTIFLLLQALLSSHVEGCYHGALKEWNLLELAIVSCNMAAVTVIHSWAAVGGDVKPSSHVLHRVVVAGKGDESSETLEWLLRTHSSCFSHMDMLNAAEAAAFSCNIKLLKLLLPHVPASPRTNQLRNVCEQQHHQQQSAALMWFALQGVK